jgi:hypothetical protein
MLSISLVHWSLSCLAPMQSVRIVFQFVESIVHEKCHGRRIRYNYFMLTTLHQYNRINTNPIRRLHSCQKSDHTINAIIVCNNYIKTVAAPTPAPPHPKSLRLMY